jgi:predicted nucleic acid-binding protein
MIFLDTTYLVRLYLDEPGSPAVRALAQTQPIAASWHAQAELLCTFHRAFRETRLDLEGYQAQRSQFFSDQGASAFNWLPISTSTLARLDHMLADAPATSFLRAADALHLACAAEHGFKEVYSNDRHFLAAAPLFGLKGINIITT